MKIKALHLVLSLMTFSVLTVGSSILRATGQTSSNQGILYQSELYFCNENASHPTLVFRSDLGNAQLIEFQYEGFEEWPPLKRCRELAERSLEFQELGIISYLTKEVLDNGLNVICISKEDAEHLELFKIQPDFVRLLLTLKEGDDPDKILDEIRGITSLSRDGKPLIH